MGAHLPLICLEPVGGEPLMSVMHDQCDARPTVTFPATRHIQPIAWCQMTLLGDKGICVSNLSRVALDSRAAGI